MKIGFCPCFLNAFLCFGFESLDSNLFFAVKCSHLRPWRFRQRRLTIWLFGRYLKVRLRDSPDFAPSLGWAGVARERI